ncbi:pentraxin-4 [Gopherus flavomarginatus]|uniref:pentraxin-4 n=1 Tax=Gopherus flavomarginatus TaxID=286002 RepID=UPI0021CBA9DB|nr:pentraxin-4 [Gopherus flavomarginatus]
MEASPASQQEDLGSLLQEAGTRDQRKPFFERFRRLEEQFRRFQEVTLLRLQGIAGNYNISYNINTRFQYLADQYDTVAAALNVSHAALREDLGSLKTWMKKLQRRTKKLASKLSSLAESLSESSKQSSVERLQQSTLLSNLTLQTAGHMADLTALRASRNTLQKELESLRETSRSQGTKLEALEQQLKNMLHKEVLASGHHELAVAQRLNQTPQDKLPEAGGSQGHSVKKLHAKHKQRKKLGEKRQQLLAQAAKRRLQSSLFHGNKTPGQERQPETLTVSEPQAARQQLCRVAKISQEQLQSPSPEKPGTMTVAFSLPSPVCNVDSMLLFPNASTENLATFGQGFQTGLHELSVCSWVSTHARSLGTILSYATEENDNKLVLHGRNTAALASIHFVIGDPAFQELPVGQLLDGRWHHMCVIWSSIQGKYWFYVDRRLASTGSKFQEGYEIPPGGSLVLGQEQDVVGGGFDPSEAFVGRLAGFAIWNRTLMPGEVSSIAIGKGLPRGTILRLADVSSLNGSIQKVNCTCLEHCL